MHSIFKKDIPLGILWGLFDKVCNKDGGFYTINHTIYNKIIISNHHHAFLDSLKPFYYSSKQHYLTRDFSYKSFVTIIRQICNFHNYPYKQQIIYNNSRYDIHYFIVCPQ